VVIDPRWDIDIYLELARRERFRIAHVIETHNHADHVSGRVRLVAATGAQAHRPDLGASGHRGDLISAGDELAVGQVRIRAIATPGHRPEHLAFEVIDAKRSPAPWMLLTGDTLLIGDIARPDLAYEATDGARALHGTMTRLTSAEDYVEVWPAHIGGSLCGGAGLSGKTSSTIGFERRNNPLLSMAQQRFVDELTANLPTRPPNVERIVSLNQRSELEAPDPRPVRAGELRELLAGPAVVLDSRPPDQFDAGHLASSVNLPVGSSGVGTRAGWLFDPDQEIVIIAQDATDARVMTNALQAVGFFTLVGYSLDAPDAWDRAGLPVASARSWDVDRLAEGLRADTVQLIDVRERSEWESGHVRGSHHVPLHRLREIDSVPVSDDGRTTVVACAAGARAAFAASLLRRAGRTHVIRVAGGGVPDLKPRGIVLALGAGH
jgi:glyoxylase-like metal-dependent hydrolase (beta-lactamase superfamily II)/rhodanese-related sulfurtransferase